MTKRDFFILLIKTFGLFSVVTSLFSVLPSNISYAIMDLDAVSIIWVLVSVIIVIGLFVLLVFKSDKVVSLLRLDKGFDDDRIDLGNLNSKGILKLAIIIIAGLLILDNVPGFLSHAFFALKADVNGMNYESTDNFWWAVSGINLIIGFLLLTNYNGVSKLLIKAESKQ